MGDEYLCVELLGHVNTTGDLLVAILQVVKLEPLQLQSEDLGEVLAAARLPHSHHTKRRSALLNT